MSLFLFLEEILKNHSLSFGDSMADERIAHEIAHGKLLRKAWSGTLWYWETPAGQIRWQRRVKMLLSHITPEMKVLEIGCGVGYFTREILKTGAHVTAIDISPDLLRVAQDSIKEDRVTFKEENAYSLSFPDNTFDTIIGSSVLHHLDIDQALREFDRVLKPGGTAFFTEPNMANPQIFLQKNIPFLKKLAGDSPDETAFFRGPLKKVLNKYKFEDITIVPFDFLHPQIPRILIPLVNKIGFVLEKIPVINEIAGSLFIKASKVSA